MGDMVELVEAVFDATWHDSSSSLIPLDPPRSPDTSSSWTYPYDGVAGQP